MTAICIASTNGIPFAPKRRSKFQLEESHSRQRICRLLELTRPASTWQPHLVQLLGQHILEAGAKQVVAFLQHVLIKGKETLQKQKNSGKRPQNCGYLVPLDRHLAPKVIDIDRWKTILTALGFEIEQPDGFHSIDYVDVLVGEGVMASALDGMLLLLSLVNGLQWNLLRMILNLTPAEAVDMCNLIESSGPDLGVYQSTAKNLLSRYPDEMAQMGFCKEHKTVVRRCTDNSQVQLSKTLSLVLTAIFQEGPADVATFV